LTISSPTNGKYFGPATSPAPRPRPSRLRPNRRQRRHQRHAKNLSVAIGTGSPDPLTGYVAVTAVNTDACVNIACTSSMPFNLTPRYATPPQLDRQVGHQHHLRDKPAEHRDRVAVADSLPFSDPLKHLLASTSTNTFKDQDAVAAGAQSTVAACTDTAGMVTLFGGAAGGTLTVLAGTVATVAATGTDNCRSGFLFVAKFPGVRSPRAKKTPTGRCRWPLSCVRHSDRHDRYNQSNEVDIGSTRPREHRTVASSDLCGKVYQSTTNQTATVRLQSSTPTVSLSVMSTGGTTSFTPTWVNGFATFTAVTFPLGSTRSRRSGPTSQVMPAP